MTIDKSILRRVRALAFDYDGVLTDNRIFLFPDGEMVRQANVRDGFALRHASRSGLPIVIITGGTSEAVRSRFEFLGIDDVYIGVYNKEEILEGWMKEKNLSYQDLLYMGDDIPDLGVMQKVFLPCCPADAAPEIRNIAKYCSPVRGGEGCVRDILEHILKAQDKWPW